MAGYKDLIVWQKSMNLVKVVYQFTSTFPESERFGLTNQMRRCSVSIPSNIAEGYGRNSDKELIHFLYISLGSSYELDTQMIISKDLKYIKEEDYIYIFNFIEEIGKMLSSLIYRRLQKLDTNLNNPLV